MKRHFFKTLLVFSNLIFAQPNCDAFKALGDNNKYEACKLVINAQKEYYQFDKRFHQKMKEAIKICPYFGYTYREIAYAYIKSGNFFEWNKNINLAVKYNPEEYLPARASLRYKFFADYEGTIKDIDTLSDMVSYDIGYSHDGTYHLNIIKGLCFRALGKIEQAIEIIEKQSKIEGDFSMFNFLHLGVLYMEKGDYKIALEHLERQSQNNNLAENQYYSGLCYKALNDFDKAKKHLNNALELYTTGSRMLDGYSELFDQIYLSDIERELKSLNGLN